MSVVSPTDRPTVYEEWFPHPQPTTPVVGRFRHFRKAWEQIGASGAILSIISEGYSPRRETEDGAEWKQTEGWIRYSDLEPRHAEFLRQVKMDWVANGALTPAQHLYYPPRNEEEGRQGAPRPGVFIHPTFVVEQQSGKLRPIGDLRSANRRTKKIHFQMETWAELRLLLVQHRFAISIDIADAYLHISTMPQDRNLMLLEILGEVFQANALMFGLTGAPRVWTKTTKVPVSVLRMNGVVLFVYIDDILILGMTREQCARNAVLTILLLQSLGYFIKWPKCSLHPTQVETVLGLEIDLRHHTLRVPAPKMAMLRSRLQGLMQKKSLTLARASSLLGYIQSLTFALLNIKGFTRHLQTAYNTALARAPNGHFDQRVSFPVTHQIREEVRFLLEHLEEWNGVTLLAFEADREMFTDASDSGWGGNMGVAGRVLRVRRRWMAQDFDNLGFTEKDISRALAPGATLTDTININILEGLAVILALEEFTRIHSRAIWSSVKHLLIRSDNITTVIYLNRQGGNRVPALNRIVQRLLKLQIDLHIERIHAEHIPGVENMTADWDSRFVDEPNPKLEYQLNPRLFAMLDSNPLFGPHTIDLMASGTNAQLKRFYSLRPDPASAGTDAFLQPWRGERSWINPPWFLIPRILFRLREQEAEATLVAPIWPSQPWYPQLLSMLVADPVCLPDSGTFLAIHPTTEPTPWTKAAAWRISGNATRPLDYRRELSTSSSTLACVPRHCQQTEDRGTAGSAGVVSGVLIPWSTTFLEL